LLSAISPFPLIKPREGYNLVGFTGWFNSFDMNNWHNSLRKVKNCNKGKSGRKGFGSLAGRKRVCIFSARDVAKNVQERTMKKKKSKKG
jgi:hypothetical protein